MSADPVELSPLERLRRFFASSGMNVEILDDEVRAAINVDLGLQDAVDVALRSGKSVIVAGTAGSGKTHLLRSFQNVASYKLESDLTDHLAESSQILESGPTLLAANEGALFLGKQKGYPLFDVAIDILHKLQRGEAVSDERLVLIDAAALDPAANGAVQKILELPLVSEAGSGGSDGHQMAWLLLTGTSDVARRRLSECVAEASGLGEPFTFRLIWQFVGDLALADEEPWFDVLLNANNEVSRRLRRLLVPVAFPLPHVAGRLWHGDWFAVRDQFTPEAQTMMEWLISRKPVATDTAGKREWFSRIRLLSLFGLKNNPWTASSGPGLWGSIRNGQVPPVIMRINRYMTYDSAEPGDDLDLWIQHDTERRLEKPSVQISVGRAQPADFIIRRNGVISEAVSGSRPIFGDRFYLCHKPTGSILSLDRGFVTSLELPRSSRLRDRVHVETDWRLLRFFSQVASKTKPELRTFAVSMRRGSYQSWRLTPPLGVAN